MTATHPGHGLGFAGTYTRQAGTYDSTRSAGSETLHALREALSPLPPRSRILDVGGGTGNYAVPMSACGHSVTVADRSPEMLAAAACKGLRVVLAEATDLPASEGSFEAVTMISMLHQVPDWRAALDEARRVLSPGGLLVLLLYTADHVRDHYFLDYFPTTQAWVTEHASLADYQAELPDSRAIPLQIRATDDLTMQIMRRHPHLALDAELARQTSYFARLEIEDPDGLAQGRARLAHDVAAGALPENHADDLPQGDATLLIWSKPEACDSTA